MSKKIILFALLAIFGFGCYADASEDLQQPKEMSNLRYWAEPAVLTAICVGLYLARKHFDSGEDLLGLEDEARFLRWGASLTDKSFLEALKDPGKWISNFTVLFVHFNSGHLN